MEAISLWDTVGQVEVVVSPWANVYVDGEYRDQVPLERPLALAPGDHVLCLSNPGFAPKRVPIRVAAGERRTVRERMDRPPSPAVPACDD